MPTFYELDSVRASALEHWWGCRRNPLAFAIVMLLKALRARTPMASDDANADSTLPFVVESLPEEISLHFEPLTAELNGLGFSDPVHHYFYDPGSTTHIYWATFSHQSGQHCARIHNRYWDRASKRERALFPLFLTAVTDGTYLVSSSGQPDTAEPPTVKMNRMPGAETPQLWAAHLEQAEALSRTKAIQNVRSREDLIQESERLHLVQRDFHVRRGFFHERNQSQNENTQAFASNVAEIRAQGAQFPEVIAEIHRLEGPKPQWSQAIWLLVLSLAVFMFAGAALWTWETTLWLIPILFFHEFGHWVAMRIFGYRNMRMFFIPLFGAAVSGSSRTVAGWKKAIVSLAGPLPGIALGALLAVVAAAGQIAWMHRCAVLMILLNVFNLVPLLPLDGGRFLHVTLFCRNRWLDVAFRVVAIVGLLGLGIAGFGRFFPYFAIALAVGLPVAAKIGRVTDRFRGGQLAPPLPGEDHIAVSTADTLTAAVKEALPTAGNRVIAQHVLTVYENINAHPPPAAATIGLLGLYGGAIALSFVCFVAVAVVDLVRNAPRHAVSPDSVQVWRGMTQEPSQYFIVTTLRNPTEAEPIFAQSKRALPSNVTMLFGDSVIVEFPYFVQGDVKEWFGRFSAQSTNTFIAKHHAMHMALNFAAPDLSTATMLEKQIASYFRNHNQDSKPPWVAEGDSSQNAPGSGAVTRTGLTLRILSMRVTSPETSLPEMIQWLASQGCHNMRYRLSPETE